MAYSKNSTLLNLFIWLNELDLFYMTLRIEPFSPTDSKNWTLFFRDSMNWIFSVIQRIVPSFLNVIQRIETFCWIWPKELSHCWKILRIESFYKYDWKFNPFWTFSYDSKNWTFFDMTRRIEPFFECDSKNCNFLQKVSPRMDFLECDSKNWIFSIWLKELKLTQSIEPLFQYDAENWTSLFSNMTHRIEHLFSRNMTNMTHRIEHLISSRIWLTELNISSLLEYDSQNFFNRIEHLFLLQNEHSSKNWFFSKVTQRIDFFQKWLKELNFLFENMTHRIEFFLIWPKERIEFLWYDTKEWIFLIWPHRT